MSLPKAMGFDPHEDYNCKYTKLFMNNLSLVIKILFTFVCLANKSSLCLDLGSIIKSVKLKYNNVFMNKPLNMRLDLTIYT